MRPCTKGLGPMYPCRYPLSMSQKSDRSKEILLIELHVIACDPIRMRHFVVYGQQSDTICNAYAN